MDWEGTGPFWKGRVQKVPSGHRKGPFPETLDFQIPNRGVLIVQVTNKKSHFLFWGPNALEGSKGECKPWCVPYGKVTLSFLFPQTFTKSILKTWVPARQTLWDGCSRQGREGRVGLVSSDSKALQGSVSFPYKKSGRFFS